MPSPRVPALLLLPALAACNGGGGNNFNDMGANSCFPSAGCAVDDFPCLGLAYNAGQTKFGLRMSEIDFSAPAAIASGPMQMVFANAVTPRSFACNLYGSGLWSWLLEFDITADTLKTGGAKPVVTPSAGYLFDDEMITEEYTTFHVQPVTYNARPDAQGAFAVATGQDLLMPAFLNPAGTSLVLLPIRQARLTTGTLSASQDCIGTYNAAALSFASGCRPTPSTPAFVDGGGIDGFIALADADRVVVVVAAEDQDQDEDQSLCVVLSGDPSMYGDSALPVARCKKDANGYFLFQGDWCSTTNSAATPGVCADAVQLRASYAASSVLINN